MNISVGLITNGAPEIKYESSGARISNLLIGEGFHWQKTIEANFAGKIKMLSEPQGNIHCINEVDIEDYISSVIASEMNPEAPIEFLKAHAIISRSWATRKIVGTTGAGTSEKRIYPNSGREHISWEEAESHTGFDVCSDDHCQRYQGIPEDSAAIETVKATAGIVLSDRKGEIADTRFSKCCGGRTELFSTCWAAENPHYLVSQSDPWCDLSDMTPANRKRFLGTILKGYDKETEDFYLWEKDLDSDGIAERLRRNYGANLGNILHIEPISVGKSGRISLLRLTGEYGSFSIGKTLAIRRLLAADCLKSSWFEPIGNMKIRGHGWGHGVGLCQIGAARMALEGKSWQEILSFYYPGTIPEQLKE